MSGEREAWTDDHHARVRALCAAATPEPWEWDAGDTGADASIPYCDVFKDAGNIIIASVNDRIEGGRKNAAFIAAARTELPAALDEIEARGKEIERLRAEQASALETVRHANEDCRRLTARVAELERDEGGS